MTAVLHRVQALVRLALDDAASPEEARTAAYAACAMIRRHGLVVTEPAAEVAPPKQVIIKTRFRATCIECLLDYRPGERVVWLVGIGAMHTRCARRERAA